MCIPPACIPSQYGYGAEVANLRGQLLHTSAYGANVFVVMNLFVVNLAECNTHDTGRLPQLRQSAIDLDIASK